ncbi:MAG TPA: F0F1 ATP synthase subunit delta [Candidatus Paceibacterota bacterium]
MNADAYAEALWQVIQKGESPKKAVVALNGLLERHGRSLLLKRIAKSIARIAERENRRSGMLLSVAREEDAALAQKEITEVMAQMKVQKDDIIVSVDKNLIGGWRLEGRDQLADASYKKYLLDMYNAATKS